MKNLNLCTDPWLPVRLCSGDFVRVSLEDFFSELKEISDLILAAHERISIMRLLICIAQRAINGPCDREEWDECKELFASKAVQYLKEWRHAFNLIGEDGAFLQPSGVEANKTEDWKDLSAISMSSAEGNTPSLFDNSAGSKRGVELYQIAIDLLTFQNFAPGGTIGVTMWAGKQTGKKSPDSAAGGPCSPSSAVHLFVCGENMLETIWYNLCTCDEFEHYRNGMGRPVWEQMPNSFADIESIDNATTTYLGRLVPLSRIVKVSLDGEKCLVAKGLLFPVWSDDKKLLFYESSMSIVTEKDGNRKIVGADIDRAMWRNLPSILHRFSQDYKSFSSLGEQELPNHYGIWIGALVLDQAKVLGTMEDYYEHLDRCCVGISADKRQATLMQMSDKGLFLIKKALISYYSYQGSSFDNKKQVFAQTERIFWNQLTAHKKTYLNCLSVHDMFSDEFKNNKLLWANIIQRAAGYTFDMYAPHLTERQLASWARAHRFLPTVKTLMKEND